MNIEVTPGLRDDEARRTAICAHERSLLIEAGAGSGKTAVMAARVTMMLAAGIPPETIAAVTFTELAAGELRARIQHLVNQLVGGTIVTELRVALPQGLSDEQRQQLETARSSLDEITCTTIHGFCQSLITPYPVEADIDPGASVIDANEADLRFNEIKEQWLREQLASQSKSTLVTLILHEHKQSIELISKITRHLRARPSLSSTSSSNLRETVASFSQAVSDFKNFLDNSCGEPDTQSIVDSLQSLLSQIDCHGDTEDGAWLLSLLCLQPDSVVAKSNGELKVYKKKGAWQKAVKAAGQTKGEADNLNESATELYRRCSETWQALREACSNAVLASLIDELRPLLQRYRTYKRENALLDFDDLIHTARDLLSQHESVRKALGQRFSHVLVDEFQDTDPIQSEIFWRLCGDPGGDIQNWKIYQLRPGALFLVGDPKQAIYRFRGADISAYVAAKEAMLLQNPDCCLTITTNFRSFAPILSFVNTRFQDILSADGQPGFTALDAFQPDPGTDCVQIFDVPLPEADDKPDAETLRTAEADAVAELCASLIARHEVTDRLSGKRRRCRAGDIALLTPSGSDLWRYEEALEIRDLPIATQAGKGFYRRQEIQDLIALTRVLADRRDTLALGAVLRGPMVGLSEEELLDAVWSLPREADNEDRIPSLSLYLDPEIVQHPLLRDVLSRLRTLAGKSRQMTPHRLMCHAVDVMRLRPLLRARHQHRAERALANVDLFLDKSRGYDIRGLSAFAETLTTSWRESDRITEGHPDSDEQAISLITMHSAKGLEWPIVIPTNTLTRPMAVSKDVVDRHGNTLSCPILGVPPAGHDAFHRAESDELARERIRLWYVATTRARELLLIPRLLTDEPTNTWKQLVDLSLDSLPVFTPETQPACTTPPHPSVSKNAQTRSEFAAEAKRLDENRKPQKWVTPSRAEASESSAEFNDKQNHADSGLIDDDLLCIGTLADDIPANIKGGRERGNVLHKLIEELLTGECEADVEVLKQRAGDLIESLGRPVSDMADQGLSPSELAETVIRTLALPEIAAIRPALLPEMPVYGATSVESEEIISAGLVDAMTLTEDGKPDIVVDWKSDVAPSSHTLEHYRAQVRAYLQMTHARKGLIVLLSSAGIVEVMP